LGLIAIQPNGLAQERIEPATESQPIEGSEQPSPAGTQSPGRTQRPEEPVQSRTQKSNANRQEADGQTGPAATPTPAVRADDEPEGTSDSKTDAEQLARDHLIAQQTMAEAALKALQWKKVEIIMGIVGATLLLGTLIY